MVAVRFRLWAVWVFPAMRLRHARGGADVLVWLRCAAHDASRESCVGLAFGAFFRLFCSR